MNGKNCISIEMRKIPTKKKPGRILNIYTEVCGGWIVGCTLNIQFIHTFSTLETSISLTL